MASQNEDDTWRAIEFSQQQQIALQDLFRNINTQSESPDPPEISKSSEIDAVGGNENIQLKSDDVKYFDSAIEEEESVVTIKRYTFYKNIYIFINRLKNVAVSKSNNKVRETFSICFHDEAFIWYSTKLTELEKTLFRTTSLKIQFDSLIKRFKKRAFITIQHL